MEEEKYKQYSIEDWVQDEPFQDYVLRNNPANIPFWAAISSDDKKVAERMKEATTILQAITGLYQMHLEKGEKKSEISFEEMNFKRNKKSKRKILTAFSAAASIAFAAIVLWLLMGPTNPVTFITSDNETEEIHLPDGSIVFLNKNSRISISNNWESGMREVTLKGEAYFMVHPIKTKTEEKLKFTVKTNGLDIEVLGTQFNVHALDTMTNVALDKGSIKLINKGGELKESFMVPGEIAMYNSRSNDLEISKKSATNAEIYWKPETIEFKQIKLSDAIEKMGTVFGITFETQNNEILDLQIDLLSVPSDNPDVFIKTVNILFADKFIIEFDPERELYTIQKLNRSID